jgi:hypothetical protein
MNRPTCLAHVAALPLRTLLACLLVLALLVQAQVAHARWVCEDLTPAGGASLQQHAAPHGAADADCHGEAAAVQGGSEALEASHAGAGVADADDDCRVSPACCHALALPSAAAVLALTAERQPAPRAAASLRLEPLPGGFERPPRLG